MRSATNFLRSESGLSLWWSVMVRLLKDWTMTVARVPSARLRTLEISGDKKEEERRGEREREREREREERRLRSSLMQWSVSWKRERERKIKFTNSAGLILTSKNIDSIIFRNFQAKQLILGWESILLFEQGIDFFQMNHGSQFAIFGIDTALFLNCNWPRFVRGSFWWSIFAEYWASQCLDSRECFDFEARHWRSEEVIGFDEETAAILFPISEWACHSDASILPISWVGTEK